MDQTSNAGGTAKDISRAGQGCPGSGRNIVALLLIAAFLVGSVGCIVALEGLVPISPASRDIPETPPTQPPLPDFLKFAGPTGAISKNGYERSRSQMDVGHRGIVLVLVWDEDSGIDRNDAVAGILSRLSLIVENQRMPNLTVLAADGLVPDYGPFLYSWAPVLGVGTHSVKVRYINSSGQTEGYAWSFVITEGP